MSRAFVLALVVSCAVAAGVLLLPTRAEAHFCKGLDGSLNDIQPSNYPERVTFCHGTGSNSNPYVVITTDLNGACGHYKEHLAARPPRTQHPDVFSDDFIAHVRTLCAGRL
jgi:hypothetical protein